MLTIKATERKEQGKGASRRLRAANKFPAIVYGGKEAAVSIELDHDNVMNMQAKPASMMKFWFWTSMAKKLR